MIEIVSQPSLSVSIQYHWAKMNELQQWLFEGRYAPIVLDT